MLLASWGEVSDGLCADLMEWDAFCHNDRAKFDAWAAGGSCPYNGENYRRAANFKEKKGLWGKGKLRSPLDLMRRLIAENFSHHGVVGEEFGGTTTFAGRQWIIDNWGWELWAARFNELLRQ